MLNEVFAVVQRLGCATAQPRAWYKRVQENGNMTFNPRIVIDENGSKHYTCFVDIYTQGSSKAGTDMSLEWSSTNLQQFKQALNIYLQRFWPLPKKAIFPIRSPLVRSQKMEKSLRCTRQTCLQPGMLQPF